MRDPALSLKELLEQNWNLANPKAEEIYFRVGEPANLSNRFAAKNYSIEVTKTAAPIIHQTGARSVFREILNVHVWVHVMPEIEAQKEKAFEIRQTIVEKVKDIIFANRKNVSGVRFTYLGGDRVLDVFPYLHTIINVNCTYSHPSS